MACCALQQEVLLETAQHCKAMQLITVRLNELACLHAGPVGCWHPRRVMLSHFENLEDCHTLRIWLEGAYSKAAQMPYS